MIGSDSSRHLGMTAIGWFALAGMLGLFSVIAQSSQADADDVPAASADIVAEPSKDPITAEKDDGVKQEAPSQPWDYAPYRVLIWVASDDPRLNAQTLAGSLHAYLDRDFRSIWRVTIADAPTAVATAAERDLAGINFETIAASDVVVAVKRDHKDAIRIRSASSTAQYVQSILATESRLMEVQRLAESAGNPMMDGVRDRIVTIDGDALELQNRWSTPETEAILVTRGMALSLTDPEAKLIDLPIEGLVTKAIGEYDKVFIVRVEQSLTPHQVSAVEFDSLMRYFGPVATQFASGRSEIVATMGRTITQAFAPMIRIEDAGQDSAKGLLRAGGLILGKESPGLVNVGDVLVPMIRKDDRNGNPILIGPLDWSFLLVKKVDGVRSEMDYRSGRSVGLQGRQNQRTFRTALKVRRRSNETLLRLHARGDEDFPLIGYEIYEREFDSPAMTFIGRTDWNGRIRLQQTEDPLRLFYVKNGGAVLARLPMVPGLTASEVADLGSDDMRLQAEAYIRGVQNAIIDLIAIRELFAARVRLRLEKGQMKEAEELLNTLRSQPTNEKIANDMGKKETELLKIIGPKNPNEYRKVENLFSATREMLSKHINPKIINDLEADLLTAERNGGKLPKRTKEAAVDNSAAPPSSGQPKQGGKRNQSPSAK